MISIRDKGRGIEEVERCMEPLYTTCDTGERSGMGFTIMQSFMDKITVWSRPGQGTKVNMEKRISVKYRV